MPTADSGCRVWGLGFSTRLLQDPCRDASRSSTGGHLLRIDQDWIVEGFLPGSMPLLAFLILKMQMKTALACSNEA